MPLTQEAKRLLAETIRGTSQAPERGLRARLLRAIHDEADRRYRLSVPVVEAGLDEAHRRRRERIEDWIDERARAAKPKTKAEEKTTRARLLAQAEKDAAATLVNRLVVLRLLEAAGLSRPPVVTGGWTSKGYREFQEFGRTLCANGTADATEGYSTVLQLLFDEIAVDLPGLFGDVGLTRLFPIPAATLRDVVEALDNPELISAWTDDTTLGWVYQYWNDPDREALDAKIAAGGKIEPHEIASKTQMFTERYMVEWLLQNSLGLTWLCMCKKHGWSADAEKVLPMLDARRAEWRQKREAGGVALDASMPIEGELEGHWKYFVPQPLPDDAIAHAPVSLRELKLLDPAAGSGHFLLIAFDLLAALYREEARHRGQSISNREISESIVENNLHGIDIDPRATQIAAASLYIKMRSLSREARPRRMNLVAPVLQLGHLPKDDPAVAALRADLKRDVGIPEGLTNRLLDALAGVDYLGSLLKVDAAIDAAINTVELSFDEPSDRPNKLSGSLAMARGTLLDKLETFLGQHSASEDLGLRLDGEQLAAGIRFVRMVRERSYDVVCGNPPYQALTKTSEFTYISTAYRHGKADLYAAFLERGLELVRASGISALLTMRGWMFLGQFAELRKEILARHDVRVLGDFDRGAFDEVPNELLSVVASIIRRDAPTGEPSVACQPTALDDRAYDRERTKRKRAATLAQVGRHEFDPHSFSVIDGAPIVYWWTSSFLREYADAPKLGDRHTVRYGLSTQNNPRWLRRPWEVHRRDLMLRSFSDPPVWDGSPWVTYIKGSEGRGWCDEIGDVVLWRNKGLELATYPENRFGRGATWYYRRGVAFANIGDTFSARAHSRPSIFGHVAGSVFCDDLAQIVCFLNSKRAKAMMESLNPGIHFLTTDVERLALIPVQGAEEIFRTVEDAFFLHERQRETSVEFNSPAPSPWQHAQDWAQRAVDREPTEPVPTYEAVTEPAAPEACISYAIGVALGRFGAGGEGVLLAAPTSALPSGMLFVTASGGDSLEDSSASPLLAAWIEYGAAVGCGQDLRTYLRTSFFGFHRKLYENRPIYFPLSSAKRNFVAFISIHRWRSDTLGSLLADHLVPTKRRLEGELDDLRLAKATGSNKRQAERRFAEVQRLLEELAEFIAKVTSSAEHGPPQPDDSTQRRDVDARYEMNLDDGVMVNSAALWSLLEPQWKEPKKWWRELATAKGKKDYDWSHVAARYFPMRVRKKCYENPSLAVAHKCFWELHPAKAFAWELRLQDEIRSDFTIDEPGSDAARVKFFKECEREATEIKANEMKRRARKAAKAEQDDDANTLLGREHDEVEDVEDDTDE